MTIRGRAQSDGDDNRLLSPTGCQRIADQVMGFASTNGETSIDIRGWWSGELRWARNEVNVASDRRDIAVAITRRLDQGVPGIILTNQLDEVSLRAAVQAAERVSGMDRIVAPRDYAGPTAVLLAPKTAIWSDVTFGATAAQRAQLSAQLTTDSDAEGMLSAGYLEMRGCEIAQATTNDRGVKYDRLTQAQCSATVRHPSGNGSGWAGISGYDWSVIDAPKIAARALHKCIASKDAVRIEPGRYTVILKPSAVHALLEFLMVSFNRLFAERPRGRSPWTLGVDNGLQIGLTKLGLKVVDERVTIRHDPADPRLGVVSSPGLGPITWIDRGVLTALEHDNPLGARTGYSLPLLNDNVPVLSRPGFIMEGGSDTVEQMIASTKRGLLVTRFSNVMELDGQSLLLTGLTRDGMWLIEQGAITKAVKNMRMTESPLFVLNRLESLGPAEPVFTPERFPQRFNIRSALVPSLKVNDFSFTSLTDAV